MALSAKSNDLLQKLAESEKERRSKLLKKKMVSASLIAKGMSAVEADMKAEQYAQQEVGMDDETRWERSQALMEPLGGISEKKIAEYGKMVKDAGAAQSKALEKYLDTVRTVASARSGPAAAHNRVKISEKL